MGMNEIKLLVVDDHPIFRAGLGALIANERDMRIIGEACNGLEAVQLTRALRPDIVLLDLQMPDMNGLEAIGKIRAECPSVRIIVVTSYAGDVLAQRAIKAGAQGYLLKDMIRRELLETIRAVSNGLKRVSTEIANQLAHHLGADYLSEREIEVLRLVALGNSNKRIALSLTISEETVKGHVKNILAKLGACDRTHAVTLGLSRGVIQLQDHATTHASHFG
jgi:DNA-binding NarL/FixJ family response regulator